MKGKDIRCPKCGAGAADVDPEYVLDGHGDDPDMNRLPVASYTHWAVDVTCTNGHKFFLGVMDAKKGLETKPHD